MEKEDKKNDTEKKNKYDTEQKKHAFYLLHTSHSPWDVFPGLDEPA